MGRYLHRKAIADVVPDNITWRRSKYMGERVAPHVKTPSLNSELHPDLVALIDYPKLKKQAKYLTENHANSKNKTQSFSAEKNITGVNQLDNWLKYYFPNGCDWADTPV